MAKKVLWLSRHKPLPTQHYTLQRMFGKDVEVAQDVSPFLSVGDILVRYKTGGYDDVVVVATLSMLDKLVHMGVRPLWAEMEQVGKGKCRSYRFRRFRRVMGLEMKFEDLGPMACA